MERIEQIADELITLKQELKDMEEKYQRKRDEMYNKLTNTGQEDFSHNGYKFSKANGSEAVTVNKATLYEALESININKALKDEIFIKSLKTVLREGTLRILKV